MTETTGELQQLKELVARIEDRKGPPIIESTGASVVTSSPNPIYNVDGSSDDPKIHGDSWKKLFVAVMAKAGAYYPNTCFVSPTSPAHDSHPGFRLGGHMTQNQNGSVNSGTCYLMPLCSWHNSKARDGIPFVPVQSTMVQLTGYLLAEPAALFEARLDGAAEHALVYGTELGEVDFRALDVEDDFGRRELIENASISEEDGKPDIFVRLRRVETDGRTAYEIVDSRV